MPFVDNLSDLASLAVNICHSTSLYELVSWDVLAYDLLSIQLRPIGLVSWIGQQADAKLSLRLWLANR